MDLDGLKSINACGTFRCRRGVVSDRHGGCHSHFMPAPHRVRRRQDEQGLVIGGESEELREHGRSSEFVAEGTDAKALAGKEVRRMDCVDCHNRPTHAFSVTAERAVNAALTLGRLPADLPFVRREALGALKGDYPSREEGQARIGSAIRSYYQQHHPDVARARQPDIDRAAAALQDLYGRNVLPRMRVTWGTHANNLGHMDSPGCFRCHDEQHKTSTGETIRQDCELCHAMQ